MSHPATQEVVQKHVAKGNVKLVHEDSLEPVFQKQMSEIGEKGAAATNDESLLHDPEEAKLVATQEALKEMGDTVNELVRTNSLSKNTAPTRRTRETRTMTAPKEAVAQR